MSLLLLNGAEGGPAAPAVLQPLRADGKILRTADGAAWRWRGFSAFRLLDRFARGEDLEPFLTPYAVLGFNLLRVWPYVPAKDWGAAAWDTPDTTTINAFVAAMGQQGWYVELTLLTDDDPARLQWAQALVPQLAPAPNLLLEAGNEPTTHKQIDTHALQGFLNGSGFLYASGDYEDSSRFYGTYLTAHTGRDAEWPRRAHDLLEYHNGGGPNTPADPAHRCPCVADEPPKLEDVSGDRATDYLAYGGACALLGGGCTFHSETGKHALPPTPEEQTLASALAAGLLAFPADAPLGPYQHDTADEAASGSLRTYRVGPYGVRIRPRDPSVTPILIGV